MLFLLAGALASGACASRQRAAAETAVARALISDEKETRLGMKVQQELQKQNVRYLEIRSPHVEEYIRSKKLRGSGGRDPATTQAVQARVRQVGRRR